MTPLENQTAATPATSFTIRYNFRTLTADALAALRADLDTPAAQEAAGPEAFDTLTDDKGVVKYKRKSVDAVLPLPSFCDGLPTLAVEAIKSLIAGYAKSAFVEKFLPIGDCSWATIETELAKTGGRVAKFDISDETWTLAAESFKTFMSAQFAAHPMVAQISARMGEVLKGKVSKNAVTKYLSEFNEAILSKLKDRIIAWATYAADHEPDNQEAFADVFSMVTGRIDGYIKSLNEAKIDFGSVL